MRPAMLTLLGSRHSRGLREYVLKTCLEVRKLLRSSELQPVKVEAISWKSKDIHCFCQFSIAFEWESWIPRKICNYNVWANMHSESFKSSGFLFPAQKTYCLQNCRSKILIFAFLHFLVRFCHFDNIWDIFFKCDLVKYCLLLTKISSKN